MQNNTATTTATKTYTVSTISSASNSTKLVPVFGVSLHEKETIGYATRYSATTALTRAQTLQQCKHKQIILFTFNASITQLAAALLISNNSDMTAQQNDAVLAFISKHSTQQVQQAQQELHESKAVIIDCLQSK
jgi:hypothetical protein